MFTNAPKSPYNLHYELRHVVFVPEHVSRGLIWYRQGSLLSLKCILTLLSVRKKTYCSATWKQINMPTRQ